MKWPSAWASKNPSSCGDSRPRLSSRAQLDSRELRSKLPPPIPHPAAHLSMRNSICRERKSSLVFHLPRSAHESSQRSPSERSSHADPLGSRRRQLVHGKGCALQAHQHIHRLRNRRTNLSNRFQARKPRRIYNISACFGKGLQSPYGVVEIRAAMQEVFRSGGQHEPRIVSRLRRCRDPLHRELEAVNRIFVDRRSHLQSILQPTRSSLPVE